MILNTNQFNRSNISPGDIMRLEDSAIESLAWGIILNSIEVQMDMFFDENSVKDNPDTFVKSAFEKYVNDNAVPMSKDFVADHFKEVVSAIQAKISELNPQVSIACVKYGETGNILDVEVRVKQNEN